MAIHSHQHATEDLSDGIRAELERRLFHLKTLYDVSTEILGSVDSVVILRNFLLMSTGNFGAVEGFVLWVDRGAEEPEHFASVGLPEEGIPALRAAAKHVLQASGETRPSLCQDHLPPSILCAVPFTLEGQGAGLVGLGAKLVGDPYDDQDQELLTTLVNNLVVALRNAASFEKIRRLNQDLHARNAELTAALRKVEILESVKASLSKFVPNTVCKMIDASPTGAMPASEERDVTVLFLDIQGYTRMCETMGSAQVSEIIEKCFSVFMDAICVNDGDVNETAGDGLMVLFLNQDERVNALQAVSTALAIREHAARVTQELAHLCHPLTINMGINSGRALVGAARFESYTGSRWTYTARGSVTNVAARLAGQASDGRILLSRATAGRVSSEYATVPLGKVKLKNIEGELEVFRL